MIERIFTSLTQAVEGTTVIAVAASFVWGILSILLSPCHLASIPLIVGFVDRQGQISTKRAFAISTVFAAGILATISLIGLLTATAGKILGDVGPYGNYFVAGIFFVVGLYLMEVISMPWSAPGQISIQKRGVWAALILGLIFGIAVGPCTFAYMAPILGVAFKVAQTNLMYGAALLIIYGLGHCSVIVFAGTFTEVVQQYMNWNERSRGAIILRRICGVLVIFGGLYLIYTAK
ncbi:MAG: cytochrome c biogenesis protein CcdA [Sedimentisphaerales bacterium]|jgi:cytochrome c-type biogenesis protein